MKESIQFLYEYYWPFHQLGLEAVLPSLSDWEQEAIRIRNRRRYVHLYPFVMRWFSLIFTPVRVKICSSTFTILVDLSSLDPAWFYLKVSFDNCFNAVISAAGCFTITLCYLFSKSIR